MLTIKKLILSLCMLSLLGSSNIYTIAPEKVTNYVELFHKSIDSGISKGISELAKDLTTYTFRQTIALGRSLCSYAAARTALLYNSGFSWFRNKSSKGDESIAFSLLETIQSLQPEQSLIIKKQNDGTISVVMA